MTDTETTTIAEIGKKLEDLKTYRRRAAGIDTVLRWIEERKKGLESATEVTCKAEFRRRHHSTTPGDYLQIVLLPPSMNSMLLLLAKDHWASMIAPLEQWLDERNIEHIESAKAD